ncbi:discoidin domain-containing protein [Paenibacillus sp. WQ 127069]|uniref:Discoidin domain-containing protein n=1 Tax=Paenibacillus baimaensis TaxID=2982185 RepID=A0ABT2UKH8_9BACL|nr:discoidin domain-containing protein [Paenibacillus sp. WQ 127069]MCU6795149.1 discoidin domain-containing protein [Paenibacillus sp. WQ 127069]
MKKYLSVLLFSVILFLMLPISTTFAYPSGLLDGKPVDYYQYNAKIRPYDCITDRLTSHCVQIGRPDLGPEWMQYDFVNLVTINALQYNGDNTVNFDFYDSSNTLIATKPGLLTKTAFDEIKNVKKLIVRPTAGITFIYEFDVFGIEQTTPSTPPIEVSQNYKEFSIPMNSFCSVSQSVDLSLNITNLKNSVADLKLFLYKKNGASLSTAGSSYDGIESTIVPATSFQLAGNETSLYHITFGGSNNNCADRVYSGKIEVDSESSSLIASGWVDGTKGNATVIINGGQSWKVGEIAEGPGNQDTTAPAAVTNLSSGNPTSSSIALSWTAPGNDGSVGTATYYDIRYSTSPITEANWASAVQVTGEPTPAIAGTSQSIVINGLSPSTTYYFALKTLDNANNVSTLSNVPSSQTSVLSYSGNIIPTTNYTVLFSSQSDSTTYGAYRAFNQNSADAWFTTSPAWVGVKLAQAKTIAKYTVARSSSTGYDGGNYTPKNWTFEGSSNGTNWTVLDTKTNQINWAVGEKREFIVSNPQSFQYYRLNISASTGGSYIAVGEIEMMEQQ